jgi:hypothetical protein
MSLLEQLENNEAVLLMYLAGELPAQDRAEVEQLLATDASLRRELEALSAAHGRVASAIRDLDVAECPPVCDDAAVRQAVRAMWRWELTHARRPAEAPAARGLRYSWWVYPLASAAVVLLAILVWWGMNDTTVGIPDGGSAMPTMAGGSQFPIHHEGEEAPPPANESVAEASDPEDRLVEQLRRSFAIADEAHAEATAPLDDVEGQLQEMAALPRPGEL